MAHSFPRRIFRRVGKTPSFSAKQVKKGNFSLSLSNPGAILETKGGGTGEEGGQKIDEKRYQRRRRSSSGELHMERQPKQWGAGGEDEEEEAFSFVFLAVFFWATPTDERISPLLR